MPLLGCESAQNTEKNISHEKAIMIIKNIFLVPIEIHMHSKFILDTILKGTLSHISLDYVLESIL